MTTANSVYVDLVRETTAGTTPTTPRMRKLRLTGESLFYRPIFNQSEELRDDRMTSAPTQIMFESGGGVNFEFSYPDDLTPLSEIYRSAFYGTWTNTATRDNDGTADSVITDVATAGTVVTCTTGTSFVAGQLVKFTGFGVTGNNGVFKCTTGSATVPAFVGSGITDEAAVAAAAKMKTVGFQGAASDITATSTGLGSTVLNFTTIGVAVGQWIKVGGTTLTNSSFATAALNAWMRITAITATTLTLDNRPTGWTTDAGTGKTIQVWFGDYIRNGTTQTNLSIEKGFTRQTTPTYIVNTGMSVSEMSHTINRRQKVLGTVSFNGMGGSQSTTSLDASPDAVTTGVVMSAHVNVGRLAENGTATGTPNWASEFSFNINNNQRLIEDVSASSPQGVLDGECTVTGKFGTYFGSNSILTRFFAGTATSFNARVQKDSQAVVWTIPAATLMTGAPNATAKNTDVYLQSDFQGTIDTLTNCHIQADRIYFYE